MLAGLSGFVLSPITTSGNMSFDAVVCVQFVPHPRDWETFTVFCVLSPEKSQPVFVVSL